MRQSSRSLGWLRPCRLRFVIPSEARYLCSRPQRQSCQRPHKPRSLVALGMTIITSELLAFQNDLRDGLFGGVGYRKCGVLHAQLRREFVGFSMKRHCRPSTWHADGFTILPPHPMIPSRPQSFHGRFLRCEAGSIAFDAVGFGIAIAPFPLRINTIQKAIAKAFDRLPDARNLCDVDACANDHIFLLFKSPVYKSRSPR